MDLTRVAVTAVATLSHTFYVDETATDSSTTVTVSIKDANGTVVASGSATHGATGVYTFTLPPQAAVALLSVAWTATILGVTVVESDAVEIVGGFFFGLAEIRAADATLADTVKYPTATLKRARLEAEMTCEAICERAFVPRYAREILDGTGTSDVLLGNPDFRTVRAVRVAPRTGQTFVALSPAELATLAMTPDGMLRRTEMAFWTEGLQNVIAEYEFGLDAPPLPLKEAVMVHLRSLANKYRTGVPDRALSFTAVDGGTYRLALPGRFTTGIPDVDAVYARYALGGGSGGAAGGAGQPASRQLNFDPQYLSMYHGGLR